MSRGYSNAQYYLTNFLSFWWVMEVQNRYQLLSEVIKEQQNLLRAGIVKSFYNFSF